jgi:hypothetical protein
MKRAFGATVFLLVGACSELPTSPVVASYPASPLLSAAQTLNVKWVVPFQFSVWACSELVSLQGDVVGVQHLSNNDNGTHAKILFLQRLSGYGQTTGYKYEAIGNDNAVGTNPVDGATIYNEVFSFRLVSRAGQFMVRTRFHTTVNSNGDVTVDILESSVECR